MLCGALVAALLSSRGGLSVTTRVPAVQQRDDQTKTFATWRREHGVEYANASEMAMRRAIWAANARAVAEHNKKGGSSFTLGLNAL
eukprot:COSAG01_NODE_37540_length_502_cov_0.893300_1_plen_85_part_10